jgi:hypothetical protein
MRMGRSTRVSGFPGFGGAAMTELATGIGRAAPAVGTAGADRRSPGVGRVPGGSPGTRTENEPARVSTR